jgi:hypothetical protein
MIVLGLAGIVWGVFHILTAVDPPGQRQFAERIPYTQAKQIVHERLFGALVRSLAGLGLALLGGRLRRGSG